MTRSHPKSPASRVPTNRSIISFDNGESYEYPSGLKLRTTQVCWGIPMDEMCFSIWVSSFIKMQIMPWDNFYFCMNTYLPEARNRIHNTFLKMNGEWLVMLDSDVIPPPDFVSTLMSHDKKMVGGWYKKKDNFNMGLPVVYDYAAQEDGVHYWNIRKAPGTGLEKVDGAGAGCWLMHRDVAKALGKNPYNMEHGGEDMELCIKVKQAGFDLWIDWSVACAHVGAATF